MQRRLHGDGTIKAERAERSDGPRTVYRARLWINGRERSRRFATRDEAETWLAGERRIRLAVRAGVDIPRGYAPAVTFSDLDERIADSHERRTRHDYTEASLKELKRLRRHVLADWGSRPVALVTTAEIREWVDRLSRRLAPQSVRHRANVLGQYLQLAEELGVIERTPRIPRPAPRARRPRSAASPQEIETALALASGDLRATVALLLAADAGLRVSEIAVLERRDLDLGGRWLTVRVGKGRKLRRVPLLTARLCRALAAFRGLGPADRVLGVQTRWGIDLRLRRLLGEAHPGLHRLRHACATAWANDARLTPWQVQSWLGHSALATTQGYVHARVEPPAGVWEGLETGAKPARFRTESTRNDAAKFQDGKG